MSIIDILIVIIIVIGLAGIIGNQYSIIKRMEGIETLLREIRDRK